MEHTIEKIVQWLQKEVKEAGANGLLVGVSGGLDSAVVAYLIKRAFPHQSLGVIMPIKTHPEDLKHAKEVNASCGIQSLVIDLTTIHDMLYEIVRDEIKQIDPQLVEEEHRLADANLRARLRMSTLYTVASHYNYLVAGTDNASEWYTGYFTKYGDGGVDLLPIVPFTKSEVQQIAKILGVPKEVIEKQPSADLWQGQTDEEEMGTTYDKIDAFLKGESIPEKDRQIIEKMHTKTKHKREPVKQFTLEK